METTERKRIAIVGAGLIGSSWAALYAAHGMEVRIYDGHEPNRRSAQQHMVGFHSVLEKHGMTKVSPQEAESNISICDSLAASVQRAWLVQESVSENYDTKENVFRAIDEHAPETAIVASSSSGLLISRLQNVMSHPSRALIAHPFNPPHLVPLVELVPGPLTSSDTLNTAKAFYQRLGKSPIVLNKEVPGHVANRLQAALWREAIQLVLDGVVSVEDVDKAVADGPGIRWALLGPHMIFHLAGGEGGIEAFARNIGEGWDAIWQDLAHWTELPESAAATLRDGLEAEMHDRSPQSIAQWRDQSLIHMLKAIDKP